MTKIAVSEFVTPPAIDWLRARGYTIVQGEAKTEDDMKALLPGCAGLLVRTAPCTRAVLESAPELRVIGKHGVGTDNIDLCAARERGVRVTFTPEANSVSVAEHALYLLLACAKRGHALDSILRRTGDFAFRTRYIAQELEGKTLGLIGLGRIGRRLGTMAALGLGMKVLGADPFVRPEDIKEPIEVLDSRDELLARSDYVSLHLPVTDGTRGFMNLTELRKMKRSACLINAARGELVVTEDLAFALRESIIAGAGIDVFFPEPPGADCPLFTLDNVVLTPHTAGGSREALDRMGLHAAMGIHEILSGHSAAWPVV